MPIISRRTWNLMLYGAATALALFELSVLVMAQNPQVSEAYKAYYITRTSDCWRRPLVAYPLGKRAGLALSDLRRSSTNYLGCGWHIPDQWGIGTKGAMADLQFRLVPVSSDLVLQAEIQSLMGGPPKQSTQVKVFADDIPVATWDLPVTSQVMTARIPQGVTEDGQVQIRFELIDPTSSSENKTSLRQPRDIMGIRWFSLNPVD